MPLERAIENYFGILKAFGYIHNHRVVHPDLKPKNIMVDDQNNMKLIDLGIPSREGANRLTYAGYTQALSTPECISSEQVKGKRGHARSDVYSLGSLLHEMLSAKTPTISPQLQEVLYRTLERELRTAIHLPTTLQQISSI